MALLERFIGVDVGLHGAVAALDVGAGGFVGLTVHDLPVLRTKTERAKGKATLDIASTLRLFDQLHAPRLLDGADVRATLEMVSAMPGQGVSAMFSFGRALGTIEAALAASRIPYDPVRPNAWKRVLRVPAAKDGAVLRADQLFPSSAHLWRGPRGGLLDGRAEAALLAYYGWTSASADGNAATRPSARGPTP
jgi:crossover junction endodeoxyribonuclease RuvC